MLHQPAAAEFLEDELPSDVDILRELHEGWGEVGSQLRAVLTPPFTEVAERAYEFITKDTESFNKAAYHHPIREAPYTVLPPDIAFPDPANDIAAADKVAAFWPQHMQYNMSVPGIHDMSIVGDKEKLAGNIANELTLISDGAIDIPEDTWELYQAAHQQEHAQDFCILGSVAARHGLRRNDRTDFGRTEQAMTDLYLQYRYQTSLYTATSSAHSITSTLRLPHYPAADRQQEERLLRAAAFIVDYIEQDAHLMQASKAIADKHPELLSKFTLRAADKPISLPQSIVNGLKESVGAAILPIIVDASRTSDAAVTEIIDGDWPRKITQKVPLGYAGPIANKGVGMDQSILLRDVNGKLIFSRDAKRSFRAMNAYWRRNFHYPNLKSTEQPKLPERTGLYCPFALSLKIGDLVLPSVITSFSALIGTALDSLDDRATPHYDRTMPYRPWDAMRQQSTVR